MGTLDEPITRQELYLSYLNGNTDIILPEPITRVERYLYALCMNGGGSSGGGSGIKIVKVNSKELPVGLDESVNIDLAEYSLKKRTGVELVLDVDPETYVMYLALKNDSGETISSQKFDFPIETAFINVDYDEDNDRIAFVLQNGTKTDYIDLSHIIRGLVPDDRTIAGLALTDDITAEQLKYALGIRELSEVAYSGNYDDLEGKLIPDGETITKDLDGTIHAVGGGSEPAVTGVKGNAETKYRHGEVNIAPADIGLEKAILNDVVSSDTRTHVDINGTGRLIVRKQSSNGDNTAKGQAAITLITSIRSFGLLIADEVAGIYDSDAQKWILDIRKSGTAYLNGTATKAAQDGNGNVIADTYLKPYSNGQINAESSATIPIASDGTYLTVANNSNYNYMKLCVKSGTDIRNNSIVDNNSNNNPNTNGITATSTGIVINNKSTNVAANTMYYSIYKL